VTDLDCVTLKQVNEAAKKYLTTNSFALVVVGSADTTRESLKVIGNFTEVYYKDPINK
jgi:predicted Zn-dependent peptidase